MEAKDTDIFISYRRVDGRDIARSIQLALGNAGFDRVFFDYSSMREGMFNEQIITAINNSNDYILVLSPQSMLRCGDPEDWVAKELQTAIDAGCKIIPVQINEQFDAWPPDFPKKFNFIKQLEFLTLRTDEFFPDSIRRLIGWLDSKPTKTDDEKNAFTLTIKVDETCELYIDEIKVRKIKGGKPAVLNDLKRGKTYAFIFESLAQRGSEMELSYHCPVDEYKKEDVVVVSFAEERKRCLQEKEQQRQSAKKAQEQWYQKWGMLKQARDNYDESGGLYEGMNIVAVGGKIGYLNEEGFEAVACEYDDACDFCGDYATVCKNCKWGIIDKIGQIVVPLMSDTPCWSYKSYKYFIASNNGRFAISTVERGFPKSFPFDGVAIFVDGYGNEILEDVVAVMVGDLWTIINITGVQSPFTLQFRHLGMEPEGREHYSASIFHSFHNVKWPGVIGVCLPFAIMHPNNGRWGYVNSDLKLTVPFVDEGSKEHTYDNSLVIIKTNGRMGLVDIETGRFVIPAVYDIVRQFYYGEPFDFFCIADGAYDDRWRFFGGRQGVVNIKGDIVVPQQYQMIKMIVWNQPFFLAYDLKDWSYDLNYCTPEFKYKFNKEQSVIYIYASDGNIVEKLKYSEESRCRDVISKYENDI